MQTTFLVLSSVQRMPRETDVFNLDEKAKGLATYLPSLIFYGELVHFLLTHSLPRCDISLGGSKSRDKSAPIWNRASVYLPTFREVIKAVGIRGCLPLPCIMVWCFGHKVQKCISGLTLIIMSYVPWSFSPFTLTHLQSSQPLQACPFIPPRRACRAKVKLMTHTAVMTGWWISWSRGAGQAKAVLGDEGSWWWTVASLMCFACFLGTVYALVSYSWWPYLVIEIL